MSDLIAKPIVKDQYWVVTDGSQKIGNVVAQGSGFNLSINGNIKYFSTSNELKQKTQIQFQKISTQRTKKTTPFADYPTVGKIYNSILDVKRKLHLFTKSPKSKCYYAAGWFVINQNNVYEKVLCPKYIFVHRYNYHGPYKTETEADDKINNLL